MQKLKGKRLREGLLQAVAASLAGEGDGR